MSLGHPALDGFTFGADPELFIVNAAGEYISAEGLIPGTKYEPFKVPNGAIQVDGMAAEFNIDPARTFEEFSGNIHSVIKSLKKFLPAGHTLKAHPVATFKKEVWDAAPDRAKELGCTPDFNAWTGECNPPPQDPDNPTTRTAAGHIHIGWTNDADLGDNDHVNNCRDLVKQLDYYLGGWSLQMDPDNRRRRLYGKAGACRYKPYGVEYRVLSNFWVASAEHHLRVWNRLQTAIWDMKDYFQPGKKGTGVKGYYNFDDALIESINTGCRNVELENYFRFPLVKCNKNLK